MNRARQIVAVLVGVLHCIGCERESAPYDPRPDRALELVIADTTSGPVAGFETEGDLDVFLGIPYAEPPVGDLRFAPPRPVTHWAHVRPAFRFGPTCPQMEDEFEPASLLHQDEDCLSLNIWTPGLDSKKRPVVVYIHGGGFIEGGSGDPLYDGEHLARRGDIVVASLNYRVAALGFLSLDSFGPEFSGSGNLALQDQTAALVWIESNIDRFGGDPDRITIMGESAGSTSVLFHMISPASKGLFQRAIAQSGAVNLARTPEQAAKITERFMELAGVRDVAGLRALSARRIVELEKKLLDDAGFEADLVFAPVLDGIVVPTDPWRALEEGAAAGIPLLHGTNLDEYRYWLLYFAWLEYIPTAWALARAPSVQEQLGPRLDDVIEHYRHTLPNPGLSGVTFALVSDLMFRAPHLRVSDLQSRHAPVWMYRFDWKSKVSNGLGACHAIELPFVFRTFDSPTSDQIVGPNPPMALSDAMMDAWIRFIRTGNPGRAGASTWPAYDTGRRATLIFDEAIALRDDPDATTRRLHDGIPDRTPAGGTALD
ncbi:acetylcholinesterase [Myxococcaceae bacterium]|nr:acetylcholinesterase [Myxococcaceae bacterium]